MMTISIVTYHTPISELSKVIDSALNIKGAILYVIDNSSTDELRKQLPPSKMLHYIFNNANIGFGAAHNIAIRIAVETGAKYHLVLNPDITFKSGTIEKLVEFMNANLDVGLVMPEILYPDGNIQYLPKLLPSPIQLLIRKTPFTRLYTYYEMRHVARNITYEAPIISGCCSLFRVSVLEEIGGYDERYFMFFEDFDISRRINKNYKTIYYPFASVYHKYERGANKNLSLFKIFIQSAIKYFNKWGWFIDKERASINKATLKKINKEQ